MKPIYGADYIFTMDYECLVIRRGDCCKPGMYRVLLNGFLFDFFENFDAVVDDFGNLVRVKA